MLLTIQQSYELLAKYGTFAYEICERCGAVLGAVRFTRKDVSAVWCSRACRGDVHKATSLRPGRPRKYENGEERRAAKTRQQRIYRLRPGVEKTPSQVAGNKELTGAKNGPLAVPPYPDILALKQPLGEHEVG